MKIQSVSVNPDPYRHDTSRVDEGTRPSHTVYDRAFFMLMKIFYLIEGGVAEAPVHDSDHNVLEKYSRNSRATTPGIKLDFCTATFTCAARSTC